VELPAHEDALPDDLGGAFVMRGRLEVEGERAALDITLERASKEGHSDTISIWRERIEHSDSDEWGLQAKLVGSLLRAVKRRLAEFTLAPPARDRRDPERAQSIARRAHEVLHRGTSRHLMAAISSFRLALEEDPGCALAHAGLSESLARKFLYWDGDRSFLRESREEARLALAYDPLCAEAHSSLGYGHAVAGDTNEAQREYRLAIQLDNDEWLAHRLLGALLARLGNFEGASPLLQRAIALRPMHVGSYDHLYEVLVRLDRYQEAI
jgi:tetratricopeptide (TPR) repeat protein